MSANPEISEAAVIASASIKVDEAGNELNADPSNIGRGVGGRTWIVDPQNYNKLMPVGSIGELVIEGIIVARGYLNNNEKTASAFITNPSFLDAMELSERIYRTGDLVRYNSDGTLSFVARKDTQIKLSVLEIFIIVSGFLRSGKSLRLLYGEQPLTASLETDKESS